MVIFLFSKFSAPGKNSLPPQVKCDNRWGGKEFTWGGKFSYRLSLNDPDHLFCRIKGFELPFLEGSQVEDVALAQATPVRLQVQVVLEYTMVLSEDHHLHNITCASAFN